MPGLDKQCSLTNGEGWFCTNTSHVWLVFFERILVVPSLYCLQCGPFLPTRPNILPLIGTNRTCFRLTFTCSKLRATGNTHPMLHKDSFLCLRFLPLQHSF